MTALTKSEMAERLFEELGLNKREAKEIVELFFEEIRGCLEGNEQVKLSGFGNFDLRDKSQRPGRNPKTGEEIPISARRVVTFRPGQKLKARVESYGAAQAKNAALENAESSGTDSYTDSYNKDSYRLGSYDAGSE
jgi:integration host factor subunit alpha